jgi:transcriptional regulator with XRE-family HTH domain
MHIGEIVKNLRKSKKLTQKEVADKVGITQGALSQIENDKRPADETLTKLASALNVSVGLIYALAIKEEGVPEQSNEKYKLLFPVIMDMLMKIVQ